MRFFSNDAKETHDEETDRPDDAATTVPQQRSGSPWSDTRVDAGNPDNDLTGKHSAGEDDDPAEEPTDEHVNPELLDGEPAEAKSTETRTQDGDPADSDIVEGELVDEGGHNAHDLGGPESTTDEHDDLDLPLDEQPADSAGTGSATGEPATEEPFVNESTVTSPDAPVDAPADAEITGSDEDPAIRDEGDFDEPHAVDPATDETLDTPADRTAADDTVTDDTVASDETEDDTVAENATATELDEPVAVTPADADSDSTTYASAAADSTAADDTVADDTAVVPAEDTAVVAAVPVAAADAPAKPGAVEEKSVETFFGADDAQAFQERWRDVQLRFVDSPKDAAAEAAGLVDEAVDQLTASLKAQKDGLLSDSDDTEKLRIELRGYRDILNKVLSL